MNRGPRPGSTTNVDFIAKASAAWGEPPDWIVILAEEANRAGAADVARRLDYSASVISQCLSASYRGDLRRLEEIVRGALMGSTVLCPVLDEIGRDQCRREQRTPFRATNSTRARLVRACRTCPNREVKS
jgi:hypothetical protein